jgi:hypothetical protein
MAHYLRKSLLTMLSHPEPQTVIELVRLLTDETCARTTTCATSRTIRCYSTSGATSGLHAARANTTARSRRC